MIRACLFDLGNVLLTFSHERMCEQIGRLCNCTGPQVREAFIDGDMLERLERGKLPEDEFRDEFCDALGCDVSLSELKRAASDIFEVNEPMPWIVRQLKDAGMRLVLLSNTSAAHFGWIRSRFEFVAGFDRLVLSYEVGALKPEPAIYTAAIAAAGCEAGECFFTDDMAENVDAARKAGIDAVQFTRPAAIVEELTSRAVRLTSERRQAFDRL